MTGMISGSQGRRVAEWLERHVECRQVDGRYCFDVTADVLAKYPALRQAGRVASYLTVLASGIDVRVHWASL